MRVPPFLRALAMAFLGFVLVAALVRPSLAPAANVSDYRVAACAERAVLAHADFYRTEPLRTCEHQWREAGEPDFAVTPFSLPPYSAAILAPLGALDFSTGRALWYLVMVISFCLTAAAVARILARPTFEVALVLAPSVGVLNLFLGETIPIALAAVALGALALQREQPRLAALAAVVAMIEPAIGLPAVLGLFVLMPRTRTTLAAGIAVLAAVSVGVFGVALNLEYAFRFLPAHEHAEMLAGDQFSMSHLAFMLGASAPTAALLGTVSYILMLAIGIVAARRLARQMALPALVMTLPLATSMLGGPYVHDVEIASALPAAMLLARDSRVARVAVTVIAIPWMAYWREVVVPIVATVAGMVLLYSKDAPWRRRALYALGAAFVLVVLSHTLPLPAPGLYSMHAAEHQLTPPPAPDLSPARWERRIALMDARGTIDAADVLRKLPTWLGLALVPFALLRSFAPARAPRRMRSDAEIPAGGSPA